MMRPSVGVLRGGTSSEYDLSLKTGAAILAALPEDKYQVRDIFIDKSGMWHMRGLPTDPMRALSQIDVVLNALHGGVGEDGTVQRMLERSGVPYSGARALPALNSLNKIRAHEILREAGVRVPQTYAFSHSDELNTGEMARSIFSKIGPPYIVKPSSEGASAGIRVARNVIELPDVIGDVMDAYGSALIQEYINGEEATVGIIEDFRGEELYALPPAFVDYPDDSIHISHSHHHDGLLNHIVPSHFSVDQKRSLADAARAAHRALDMSHFSRADFILTPRGPYLLEVNALPGLYQGAAFPAMLESVGSSVLAFLEHIIGLARRG